MVTALLSTTYFGPVQWYQKLNRYPYIYIERCESFIKQTYRNRCVIATTNGLQTLSLPIEHNNSPLSTLTSHLSPLTSHPITDIRISNHGNWRHLHWNALMSAYGDSPFFDYYVDDIRPFFEQRWENLFDFNMAITHKLCELLDIHPTIRFTDNYQLSTLNSQLDFRDVIRPKNPLSDPDFTPRKYYQVYQQKWGFQPNLSILDLLFNMGNESILYL